MTSPDPAPQPLCVLHLEDNENDHVLVRGMLEADGLKCEFSLARSQDEFQTALQDRRCDLIISDYSLPSFDGLKALAMAREARSEVPFIFFSGTMGEEVAVESLRTGAVDYVVKQRPRRLVPAVRRALQQARDQVARAETEDKIRDQAALIDKASDAIIVRDLNNQVTSWNAGAERLYGWTAAEALGRDLDELYHFENPAQFAEAWKDTLETGEWKGVVHQINRTSTNLVVASRWTLVRGASGNPRAILVINTDLTEVKKLEAQLLRSQRLESIGMLAGGIAHDLNNILAPIVMSSQLIEAGLQNDESRQMLKIMQGCARRGADLVRQILLFARGTSGETGLFQFKPMVSKVANFIRETFPRSIRVETNVGRDLPMVIGNPSQMHQVLMNLCINARDAMPNGGVLALTLEAVKLDGTVVAVDSKPVTGHFVVMSVSDTGSGMTPEVIAKIFDPFFTTKPADTGTGLGLSTVRSIVASHNGFTDVFSRPGLGTTFKVYLPAAPTARSLDTQTITKPPPEGSGQLIVVLDDEMALSAIMRGTLESYNYRVLAARGTAEAVSLFSRHNGDVKAIVMDLFMPGVDTPEAILSLGQAGPRVKIVGLAGMDADVEQVKSLNVHTVLKKPYSISDLLFALHHALAEEVK